MASALEVPILNDEPITMKPVTIEQALANKEPVAPLKPLEPLENEVPPIELKEESDQFEDPLLQNLPMIQKQPEVKVEPDAKEEPINPLEEPVAEKRKARVPKPKAPSTGEPLQDDLNRFFKKRSRPPTYDLFKYDKQGNLVEYDATGQIKKTIVLPTYRPPTEQELHDMEQERADKIALANRAFEDARRRLYSAIQENKSRSEILDLNREVRMADIELQSVRFPLRAVESKITSICDIDFNQIQEKRKFPYPISIVSVSPYTLQQLYARVGEVELPPLISVPEIKQKEEAKETIILFSDQDMETNPYGFMALGWPVSITINNTTYPSARHAIFAELAKEFGDTERADTIESAESANDVRYSIEDVAGGKEINQLKWNKTMTQLINIAMITKYKQYPELAQRLMETPTPSVIGAYEPNDIQLGIGISVDNVKARDKLSWTGENILGKALMKIRDILYAERAQATIQPKRSRKPKSSVAVSSAAPSIPAPVSMAQEAPMSMAQQAPVSIAPAANPAPSVRRGPRVAPKVAQPL